MKIRSFYPEEKRAIFSLSLIMTFRMLGLFMILPVFSMYIAKISFATPFLIGLAIGIYGLTQAFFQIPLGMLSDRYGRKPIIALGLVLLAAGSVIAAHASTIYGMILGRALQGMGAVGSTTMAMVADLTQDENRSSAMAMMGLSIGLSFALAMVLGPTISSWFHLSGVFWATGILAFLGIILLYSLVPVAKNPHLHADIETLPEKFKSVICDRQLLRLQFGIFNIHCILTAMFIVIPLLLKNQLHLNQHQQGLFYLVVLFVAFLIALPLIILAEKKQLIKSILIFSIIVLLITQLGLLLLPKNILNITLLLGFFFVAFTWLEASLPSLVSKLSPINSKGTAMGVFSASQFLGIFIGGSLGGWLLTHYNATALFVFSSILCLIWLAFALTMHQPPYLSTLIFSLSNLSESEQEHLKTQLSNLPGVKEAVIMPAENLVYVKVEKKVVDLKQLRGLLPLNA